MNDKIENNQNYENVRENRENKKLYILRKGWNVINPDDRDKTMISNRIGFYCND